MNTSTQTDIDTIVRTILVPEGADFSTYAQDTHRTPVKLQRPLVVLRSVEQEEDVVTVKACVYAEPYSLPKIPAVEQAIEYGICGPLSHGDVEVLSVSRVKAPAVNLPGMIAATVVEYRLEVANV